MSDYYSHDQEKMNVSQIYALKRKTFPYLDKTDVRLKMSDRIIIEKELDLNTDSVLSDTDKSRESNFLILARFLSMTSSHRIEKWV